MSNNQYYEQDTEFVLGFAGSGKSTVLAKRATPTTLVLVPTHKAADVLINKGLENVYTIHSVLKLVPSINENFKKKMTTRLKKIGATDLSKITDVFIDEFSMINLEILEMLFAVLPVKAKVTIFGDPYQLPPVTGDRIEPWEPITELTTQHRSKNEAGTALFMAFMESIKYCKASPNLSYIKKGTLDDFNSDTDRILAFTNQRVVELNNLVATDSTYYYDEELLMNGLPVTMVVSDFNRRLYPSCVSKGRLLTTNKLIKASDKASGDILKYRTNLDMYKQTSIDIEGVQYLIYYDPNHYQTEKRLKKEVEIWQHKVIKLNNLTNSDNIPDFCRKNRGAPGVLERGKAWSKYLAHTGYVFNLARPFCTTVHKAQGSEFEKVFIDIDDLKKAAGFNIEQYQRLMYVALSRAINEIIII